MPPGGEHARVLLSFATGAGKTVIAANLLWRLHDRDELHEQMWEKLSRGRSCPSPFPSGLTVIAEHGRTVDAALSRLRLSICLPDAEIS